MFFTFIHYSITNSLVEILTPRPSSFTDRISLGKINGNNNYIMLLYQQRPNGLRQNTFEFPFSLKVQMITAEV